MSGGTEHGRVDVMSSATALRLANFPRFLFH
jgi:hypothetical protein